MTDLTIDPGRVLLDLDGIRTRRWFVQLPPGVVADRLKEPGIWARVQQSRQKTLHVHDHVYIAGDGFSVDAVVTASSPDSVVLAMSKIVSHPERTTRLFADDNYRVEWDGDGYHVARKSDGRRISLPLGSEALAVLHIQRQYPAPAA